MHVGRGIGLALAVLLVAAVPPAARADTPWSIGAAKVDTTPAAFDAAQDLQDFPEVDPARGITCPRAVYNGPRLWRVEGAHPAPAGPPALHHPGGTTAALRAPTPKSRPAGHPPSPGSAPPAKIL